MSFQIKSAKDMNKTTVTYLIYGEPGKGKTHTINFLPGKTLYISVDKSEKPLEGNESIDILDFNTHEAWKEWGELTKYLNDEDLSMYDNVVIDNISELFRSMLANLGRNGRNNRTPEMAHYQQVDFFTIDSFRFLQNLNKRLVFLAWETTAEHYTEGGQQFTRTMPDIRHTIRDNVAGLCQVVARLVINEETGNRGFILTPSNTVWAKNQLSQDKHCKQDELFQLGKDGEE
ncbi:AAA family ATPase [Staphylococcus xylosus]|uniref:AAA family ATPase n=1 Tax=Staphylococcus xylosus TaxID=1288 RepID=UPI000D1F81D1|nr:AAA family ATPase [Staphylococcus xylosus]PTI25070.1 DNA-binding protein [Staphylococcus xylosus]